MTVCIIFLINASTKPFIIPTLTFMARRDLPSTPYTIESGVPTFNLKNLSLEWALSFEITDVKTPNVTSIGE